MKKIFAVLLAAMVIFASGCQSQDTGKIDYSDSSFSLSPKPLAAKSVKQNPYLAKSESNIHNDGYNSDSTDAILPLGIYTEVNSSLETVGIQAPPAIFYDEYGNAISPLLGGITIRDLNADVITTIGSFIPSKDDNGSYSIQSSYSFVDAQNNIVCPTSHNHVLILKTMDEDGNILETFEKIADIDIKKLVEAVIDRQTEQNLLAVTYDYEGNLWFVTGGFRIYPDREQVGYIGYIEAQAIEDLMEGKKYSIPEESVYVYETIPGEGAENGIASCEDGCVILTNKACYLLKANEGVDVVWRTEYGSNGANDSEAGSTITGGGLSWGGGSSPTLTQDYVLFTDNLDPVNLIALDIKTGKLAASAPVLDDLAEGQQVSVENSIIVYDGEEAVSTIVCNWFGAGSADLAKDDSDSSIQSFENIYDVNWMQNGNEYIMPGIERVDLIETENGKEMKTIWSRNDISSTSIFKLSTANGYLYGYDQDPETKMWRYIILDFETGKTVYTKDVSSLSGYNNMAIGMFTDGDGNTLYCPTGCMELLRLQDRFVYLPEIPYREVDLDSAERSILTDEEKLKAGIHGDAASYVFTASVENVHTTTTVAFRGNGLEGTGEGYTLYAYSSDGNFKKVNDENWSFVFDGETLSTSDIYEIHIPIDDNSIYDIDEAENNIRVSVVLVNENQ